MAACARPVTRWWCSRRRRASRSPARRCARRCAPAATGRRWCRRRSPAIDPPPRPIRCARSSSCSLTGWATGPTRPTAAAPPTRPRPRRTSTRWRRAAPAGCCGRSGPGRAPSSEVAHWAMLGYRPDEFPGRAVLEALGHGRAVGAGRGAGLRRPAPGRATGGALWATGRAGADDAEDARALLGALPAVRAGGLTLRLEPARPAGRGRAGRRRRRHDGVTDSDPFFRDRHPVMRPRPLVAGGRRDGARGRALEPAGRATAWRAIRSTGRARARRGRRWGW